MNPETPCTGLCTIEHQNSEHKNSLCIGCGRTLGEIARWGDMTSHERLSIMATLNERMRTAGLAPPRPDQQ